MRYGRSSAILAYVTLLCVSVRTVRGKSLGANKEFSSTIKSIRQDLQNVLQFIDHLSEDVENSKTDKGDKSRSGIPYDQELAILNNLGAINNQDAMNQQGPINQQQAAINQQGPINQQQAAINQQGPTNQQQVINQQGDINQQGAINEQGATAHQEALNYKGAINNLLADESVIKSTAKKAAKAVANSAKATLKTQKGVKQISKGLIQLKTCLETFEKTIKI